MHNFQYTFLVTFFFSGGGGEGKGGDVCVCGRWLGGGLISVCCAVCTKFSGHDLS